ncbi:Cytochrome c551 peroxidase [Labilithrix luteola]|uniref:Cytochrome c551 peroxidase n=1 Tax=Labilithrix luteola TaxID=1391654 RepID=A0A0K1PX58_9BACT|nr:cytochrome c peroxidase [Labilithrix luteola]AKU97971.1 Cytochrome c551 peroxidase [Labilithrix luteola]
MRGASGLFFALVAVTFAGGLAAACSDDSSGSSPGSVNVSDASVDQASPPTSTASPFCVDGKPADYPPGPYDLSLLNTVPPDLTFESPDGPVAIKSYFEPCAPKSRLLVVRSTAAWCGSCDWHAKHTNDLFGDARYADRLLRLDLLVADEDNMPADQAAAKRWITRVGTQGKTALDPAYRFQTTLLGLGSLPAYTFIDTRTMTVVTVATDPDPESFARSVLIALADLDKAPRPTVPAPTFYDGIFTQNRWDMIRGMKLVDAPPPDPTNEYADVPAAAAFGKTLFSDAKLSPKGNVSCATCHDPLKSFADGAAQSTGVSLGDRNSPSVALAAHARWQFWDGRADTLWAQALGPFENPKEFGGSRLFVAKQIVARYPTDYGAVFSKYPLPDLAGLPDGAKPGDPAWDALTQKQRDDVTRVYVNVGKAIAAFERTLRVAPSALDRYADGDTNALSKPQKDALNLFFTAGCQQCHWGPRMTDDAFHVIRFPTGRQDGAADRGRIDILPDLAKSEFLASTSWSDAPSAAKTFLSTAAPSMIGAFKTPPLRGVAQTAPYGHGGKFATLLEVSKHYGQRSEELAPGTTTGTIEPWVANFDGNAQTELPTILEVLTADAVP